VASQQQWITETSSPTYQPVAPDLAHAASRYQHQREREADHLTRMANVDLATAWSGEVRELVLATRSEVNDARETRARFRAHVRDFVVSARAEGIELSTLLKRVRLLLQRLESSGAIRDDGGWFEAEVLEWSVEEFVQGD
jgi:hypothetical protein